MYKLIKPFGIHIDAESIGKAWMDTLDAVLKEGDITFDEGRKRLSLQNVRIRISNPKQKDKIIEKYADKEKIDGIIFLTFKGEEMYDFDVVPSFSPGAKSYYARLKDGRMDEYVVKRLSKIPESKKGVISFIHWDDYSYVLDTPYDDYLPCVLIVQVRLIKDDNSYKANINWMARSMDIFQKGNGNMIAILMLANKILKQIEKNLNKKISINALDGFVTDIHIYSECQEKAEKILNNFKEEVNAKNN
jgi:thymidylate synthase